MRDLIDLIERAIEPKPLSVEDIRAFADQVQTKLGLRSFWLSLYGEDIKLDSIIVDGKKGQGLGTQALEALCAFADARGRRIILTPGQRDDRHGTTSTARLIRFYKRFGFVENKGRGKDFSITAGMYRDPR